MALSPEFPGPLDINWRKEIDSLPEAPDERALVADNFFGYFLSRTPLTFIPKTNISNFHEAFKDYKREHSDTDTERDLSLKDLERRSRELKRIEEARFKTTTGAESEEHWRSMNRWNVIMALSQIVRNHSAQQRK